MDIFEHRTVARLLEARNRVYTAEPDWSVNRPVAAPADGPAADRPTSDAATLAARAERDRLGAWYRGLRGPGGAL